jgi:hypothetical protein
MKNKSKKINQSKRRRLNKKSKLKKRKVDPKYAFFKNFKDYERFCVVKNICKDFDYNYQFIKNYLMFYLSKSQAYRKLKMIKDYIKRFGLKELK